MKRIGITGGIGTGKSFLSRLLALRGIKVYDCDDNAKRLMLSDMIVRDSLIRLIGADAYSGVQLNKPVISQFLLDSEENKNAVNAIVHPAVIRDFHDSGLQWMESAILFEANLQYSVDVTVCVSAPEKVRIERIVQRDKVTEERARQWIDTQMKQERKEEMSDFVIVNDGTSPLEEQVDMLLKSLQ